MLGGVDPGHEFAIGAACGGELFVAFFELQPQVDDLLFEEDEPPLEFLDVGRRAKPGCTPGLFTEHFGQSHLELLGACGHAGAALLGCEEVGLQRSSGDCGPGIAGVARLRFGGVEMREQSRWR